MSAPTETEVSLARGVMALARAHENGGDPRTWHITEADWGDGRTTHEVHNRHPSWVDDEGRQRYTEGLVCQFRPDDADGTRQDAQACIDAAAAGLAIAEDVIRRHIDREIGEDWLAATEEDEYDGPCTCGSAGSTCIVCDVEFCDECFVGHGCEEGGS